MSSTEQTIIDAAKRHGVDPTTALTIFHIEDPSGDPAARNPSSSATGIGQFIPATAQQYGLTDRTDVAASADAMARYIADNNRTLTRALGRAPTVGETYLAYQQGASGAVRLLSNPDAPASSIVGSAAVSRNVPASMRSQAANMTAGQFANIWTDRATQVASTIPPGSIPDVGGTALAQPKLTVGGAPAAPASIADLYGQHYSPVPLAPALKNVSGPPDARDGLTPVASALGELFSGAAPAAPQQQTVNINGHPYVVGQSYQLANGASFTAGADGKFTKTANPVGNPTPLQLAIQSQQPGAMANLNNTVDTAKGVASAAGGAVSKLGGLLGGMFSGGSPAPAAPTNPNGPSNWASQLTALYSAPPEASSLLASVASGSITGTVRDPATGASVPTATAPTQQSALTSMFNQPNRSGSPDERQAANDARNSSIQYTDQGIAGTVQMPLGARPASVPDMSGNSVAQPGHPNSDNGGWGAYTSPSSVASLYDTPPPAYDGAPAAPAAPAAPSFAEHQVTEHVQQLNPAYQAWEADQSKAAMYGVEGVASPTLDANGNVKLPSIYVGASTPAPPKYITVPKVTTIRVPVAPKAAPAAVPHIVVGPATPAAPAPQTLVQMYQAQGLSPSAAYAKAAAPALASQPYGGYQAAGGPFGGNSGGQDRSGGSIAGGDGT